ncbi:MAG: FAD-dependent oxidoreductase [Candidatus Paceibacterota bacterium]
MRIAIVGGGSSGLVAAYLLGDRHEVHLYECGPQVGGHVRTLGQNVNVDSFPPGKVAENGPSGFHVATSPTFMRLLAELRIPTKSFAFGSNLFLRDDQDHFIRPDLQHWRRRFIEPTTGGLETALSLIRFLVRTRSSRVNRNGHKQLADALPHKPFLRDWFRCILMLCFSRPMELVDSLPISFASTMLRQGLLHAEWKFIPGGVYSYQAKILSQFGGQVFLNSPVDRVFRDESGVRLSVQGNLTAQYDKLIIATPPGRVLSMLDRPTAIEAKFFSEWGSEIPFRTITHTDLTMYRNKRSARPTIADFFQRDEETFGYNCCVSRLYSGTNEFNFSYNMDDLIEPAKRLDSHEHRIPAYSVAALRHRQELIAANGDHDTFYAGAYLDFGLHEGAVSSANQVARLLGERSLTVAEPPQQL